eukprot:scaffold191771_cov45-Prasinocladus_malaysianus.AAC.1
MKDKLKQTARGEHRACVYTTESHHDGFVALHLRVHACRDVLDHSQRPVTLAVASRSAEVCARAGGPPDSPSCCPFGMPHPCLRHAVGHLNTHPNHNLYSDRAKTTWLQHIYTMNPALDLPCAGLIGTHVKY